MYFSLRRFRSVVVQALILFKLLTHLFVHFSLRLFFFSEIFFRFSNHCMLLCVYQGVYVPVGGKQLINFMDDFNMPAKDTFGSQPPLELIRLWLDYGFWYDRLKQTVKYIKVSVIIALST